MLRRQEAEVQELRDVISLKDGIIRSLGGQVQAASEAVAHVVRAKDDVIRDLGSELVRARSELQDRDQVPDVEGANNGPQEPPPGKEAPGPTAAEGGKGGAANDNTGVLGFTVLPTGTDQDARYVPADGSVLEYRLAAFLNSRPSRMLFTRLDAAGSYLYGRLLVRCVAVEGEPGSDPSGGREGVSVRLMRASGGAATGEEGRWQPLEDFVARHEAQEHALFDRLFASPLPEPAPAPGPSRAR